MKEEATSLDRLHDIVVPADVPWWPPAPGWYVVLAILFGLVVAVAVRLILRWKANAYRRAALAELAGANSVAGISEILKRTALSFAPREELTTLTGAAWPAWLSEHAAEAMSDQVERQLSGGVYGPTQHEDTTALRQFAADWIRHHRIEHSTAN